MDNQRAIYRLGGFTLVPGTRVLLGEDGEEIHLAQKPFSVLVHLIENRHRLVTREELLANFWHDREVYDQALTRCMSSVRKALADQSEPARYIETRWAEGYRYIGPFEVEYPVAAPDAQADATPAASTATIQPEPPSPRVRQAWYALAGLLVVLLLAGVSSQLLRHHDDGLDSIDRIAVLPVQRASADDAWLTQAIDDRIITALSRIDGLTVIATDAPTGEWTTLPLERLNQLRVDAYLTVSVAVTDEEIGLSARLTSATDGSVLWTHQTAYPRADLMRAEGELAHGLASRLLTRLRTPVSRPSDEVAYRHFLRGRFLWNQRTAVSLRQAIKEYEASLARDPNFAEAHAALAEAYLMLPGYASAAPREPRERARAAALRALELDPGTASAYSTLATVAQYDYDWAGVERHFTSALALNPSNGTAQQWLAESYCFRRRFEECEAALRVALEIDPLSPIIAATQGAALRFKGDLEGAARLYAGLQQRWPDFLVLELHVGLLEAARGDIDKAIRHYERALPAFGYSIAGGPLVHAYARAGRLEEARALYARMRAEREAGYVSAASLSVAELGLGDTDAAFRWLEQAVEDRDEFAVYLSVDAHFDHLRDDPRYLALLRRMNITPRQ